MAAGPPAEVIPHFQEPESTVSPAIKSLLHEKVVVENGISYAEYKGFGPCDPTEMKKSSKNALFYIRDSNAYFDTRSVLLHVKWYAYKDDDQPLVASDKVTSVLIWIIIYIPARIMYLYIGIYLLCLSYRFRVVTPLLNTLSRRP